MEMGRMDPPQGRGGEYVLLAYFSTCSEHINRLKALRGRLNDIEKICQKLSNVEHKGATCWLELKDFLSRMFLFEKFAVFIVFFLPEEQNQNGEGGEMEVEKGELVYTITQGVVGETYQRPFQSKFETPNEPRVTVINLLERLNPTHRGHKLSMHFYALFDHSLVYEKLGIPENTPPFGFGNILDTNNSSLSRMKAYEALVKPHQTTTNNNNDFQVPFILYGGHFIFLVPPPPPSLPPPSPVSFTFKRLNDDQTMKIYRSFFGKTQFAAVDPILSLQKTGKYLGCFAGNFGPFSIVAFAMKGDWVSVHYAPPSSSSSLSLSPTTVANNNEVIMVTGLQFWKDGVPLYREDSLSSSSSSSSFGLLVRLFLDELRGRFGRHLLVDVDKISCGGILFSEISKMAIGVAQEYYDTFLQPFLPSIDKNNWPCRYLDPLPASTLLYFEPPPSLKARM